MQLGGPRVMGENGVSHYTVNDDLEGVKVILRWLSYCPAQLGAEPPLLPTNDPVDRSVAYEPTAHEKFDPRAAIMGMCSAPACRPLWHPAPTIASVLVLLSFVGKYAACVFYGYA
jgi:hypothetical protein